jgi:hypothetical protein
MSIVSVFELDALLDVRQRLNVPERVRGVHARELPVAVLAEWHLDVKRGRDFRRPRVRLLLRQPWVEADRVPGRVAGFAHGLRLGRQRLANLELRVRTNRVHVAIG